MLNVLVVAEVKIFILPKLGEMRNTRQNTCDNTEITLLCLYSRWRFLLLVLFQ